MVIEYVHQPCAGGWQNLRDKGGNKSPFSICERTHRLSIDSEHNCC
jgi:hypothetical protein